MFSALALAAAIATQPPQHLRTIDIAAPKATLHVQVARTEEQRELGLMSVTRLAPHTGMLFVFDQEAQVEFWMKDTLIPLDMVFVGSTGIVNDIAFNVPTVAIDAPDDTIPRRSGRGRFVIELPAGEAEADGIVAGAHVSIPKLP